MHLVLAMILIEAHGGGGFRGPPGGMPPGLLMTPLTCTCCRAECSECTPTFEQTPEPRFRFARRMEIVRRMGDLAHVRYTICFETIAASAPMYGVVRLDAPSLLAPFAAMIRRGKTIVRSGDKGAATAPIGLSVVRRNCRRSDLRVRGIVAGQPLWVTVDCWALLIDSKAKGTRLYRIGNRVLAVDRKIRFVDRHTAKARWPRVVPRPVEAVGLLEAAATGEGLPPIRIGDARVVQEPLSRPSHEPSDPEPPPRPPPANPPMR